MGPTTICGGNSVTLQTASGNAYQWRRNGSNINGATSSSYTVTQAGAYTVRVTNGGVTTTSAAVTITVVTMPAATISANGPTTFSAGGSVVLSTPTGTGFSYTWLRNGAAIAGASTSSYTATVAGNYSVTVANGACAKTSNSITVAVTSGSSACTGNVHTETPATWGAAPAPNNAATYLATHFATAFPAPNYFWIGCGSRTLRLTSAAAVRAFLPSNGTVAQLPLTILTDPGTSYSNSLASELVALKLSIRFDDILPFSSSSVRLRNMVINSGTYAGWTVEQFVTATDAQIGGCGGWNSLTTMHTTIAAINAGYQAGTMNSGFLRCPGTQGMVLDEPTVTVLSDELAPMEEEYTLNNSERPAQKLAVDVFPNPARSFANLSVTGVSVTEPTMIEFRAANGVLVERYELGVLSDGAQLRMPWNVEGLGAGLYLYAVTSGGQVITGKIMVE
jgi:hypothetical protein